MSAAADFMQVCATHAEQARPVTPSLAAYWDQLAAHDWWFSMSDDDRAYRRGTAERDRLWQLSKLSADHSRLYDGFAAHYVAHKTPEPKPARPAEVVAA